MKMTNTWLKIAVFAGVGLAGLAWAVEGQETKPLSTIQIDILVTLEKANVVFNLDHLAFTGDLPVSMKAHGWSNNDLRSGVKVNGGAVARCKGHDW